MIARRQLLFLLPLVCWIHVTALHLRAAESSPKENPSFSVNAYVVSGSVPLTAGTLEAIFSRHTGTNVGLAEIVRTAAELQSENEREGYPEISVAIMPGQITNGIVTLNIFHAANPQIVVAGRRYLDSGEMAEAETIPPASAGTNETATTPAVRQQPATPEEMAKAQAALMQALADLAAREKDRRIHVVSTNAGPRFDVEKYLVMGNSVLKPETISMILTNIDGAFGTNVSFDGIRTALAQLQEAYRERGFVTVAVGLPQQKLTNATVKIQVSEGRLAAINVKGNNYFSSNNVMRALPGLHMNTILNGVIFQAELNRANANQDRQIYPVISPGLDPDTSELTLKVKDRLPLHAKIDFNNESSPGTPVLRVNSSAVYDNLWQMEHSLGVQYGFSPETFKQGSQWDFYDRPLVANYGGFYRLPLGSPQPVEEIIAGNPDVFGYSEATHKFNLPPPSGQAELTIYASRSTIDTGLENLSTTLIDPDNPLNPIVESDVQQDITINDVLGFRLNKSLPEINGIRSTLSGGMDFKIFSTTSFKTNIFTSTQYTFKSDGSPNPPIISSDDVPVPATVRYVEYLPLALHYDATLRGILGVATLGLDASGNAWYSGSTSNLQSTTGSAKSTGHWLTLDPSLVWVITLHRNWLTTVHANGQWASEPLISNEQFGAGGVNSVRGYHEGEVFGDSGWHASIEQATPRHVVGLVYGDVPLTIRAVIYTDYARTILLDPQGRPSNTALWGAGFGGTASVGSHWEARFLFSLPLLSAGTTEALQPFFNFGLTAQF